MGGIEPARMIYVLDLSGVDLSSAAAFMHLITSLVLLLYCWGDSRHCRWLLGFPTASISPGKHEFRFGGATPCNSFCCKHTMIIVKHLQSINKTKGNGILEMSSTSSPSYRCEACGKSFDRLQELEQHKRQEHQK